MHLILLMLIQEAIAGKCDVVCISKDQRNRQPSVQESKLAHYVFYRTFNVQDCTISDLLGEEIGTIDVKFLLNKNNFLLWDHTNIESRNLALSNENRLVSVVDTPIAGKAVENHIYVGSLTLNDVKGTKGLLDKSKSRAPENCNDDQPDETGSMEDIEKKLVSNKDTHGVGINVQCEDGVCSLLVKDDEGLKENADASGSNDPPSAASCGTQVVLGFGQETRLRSLNSKQTEVKKFNKCDAETRPSQSSAFIKPKFGNPMVPLTEKAKNHGLKLVVDFGKTSVIGSDPSSIESNKEKTDSVNGIHIAVGAARKPKSVHDCGALEERPSKKHKPDGLAPSPRDDGEIRVTPPAVNNKASQPAGAAAKTSNEGKIGKELDGSGMFTQRSGAAGANSKALPPVGSAVVTNDMDKTGKHLVGTSNGIPRMLKSNSLNEDKSNNKLLKPSTKQLKVVEKSAIASNASKLALVGVSDTCDGIKLDEGTSHGMPKKLNSNGIIKKESVVVCEVVAIPSQDAQKSALASNASNKAPQHTIVENNDGEKLDKGLKHTKGGPSHDKSNLKSPSTSIKQSKDADTQAYGRLKEVTQRPPDGSRWMTTCSVPWEERMKEAHDRGTLVLLQNLDPTYTSLDVENIVWHGFGYGCAAKMVPRTAICSPHSGQAYAIFKTREAANHVIRKLGEECLMLPNRRPLVGSSGVLSFPGKQSSFPGHLFLDKLKHQMSRDSREAVSTSHFSQPNTLEYEMALDWCVLQDRSELWWKMLHKEQRDEIEEQKARLKPE